jgi:methionyl-tRNA formyltransferase
VDALQRSSGKSLEEAAEILYEAMKNIMDGELTPPAEAPAEVNMADYMNVLQQSMQNVNMEELAKNMQNLMSSMFNQNKEEK